jgi:hypothetical protein
MAESGCGVMGDLLLLSALALLMTLLATYGLC